MHDILIIDIFTSNHSADSEKPKTYVTLSETPGSQEGQSELPGVGNFELCANSPFKVGPYDCYKYGVT